MALEWLEETETSPALKALEDQKAPRNLVVVLVETQVEDAESESRSTEQEAMFN